MSFLRHRSLNLLRTIDSGADFILAVSLIKSSGMAAYFSECIAKKEKRITRLNVTLVSLAVFSFLNLSLRAECILAVQVELKVMKALLTGLLCKSTNQAQGQNGVFRCFSSKYRGFFDFSACWGICLRFTSADQVATRPAKPPICLPLPDQDTLHKDLLHRLAKPLLNAELILILPRANIYFYEIH